MTLIWHCNVLLTLTMTDEEKNFWCWYKENGHSTITDVFPRHDIGRGIIIEHLQITFFCSSDILFCYVILLLKWYFGLLCNVNKSYGFHKVFIYSRHILLSLITLPKESFYIYQQCFQFCWYLNWHRQTNQRHVFKLTQKNKSKAYF